MQREQLRCSRAVVEQGARRLVAVRALADEVLRSVSENGEVSVLVCRGTNLVSEACARHKTAPTASAALGRALIGTLLMGCFKGEDEKTQVMFKGNGPLGSMQIIADPRGNVKGRVDNPACDPPLRPDGKLNVGGAVGRGVLSVVRSHPAQERPYTGLVPIVTGEVAEDLAQYMVDSEQTNSALGLGVSINRDAGIRAAGGFLVQVLPFASESVLQQLESTLSTLPSVTEMLHQGMSTEDITRQLLKGLGVADGGFKLEPKFGPCDPEDLKQRMKRAVALLGAEEVKDIMEKEGKIEVKCEFCNNMYQFEEDEVMAVIAGL